MKVALSLALLGFGLLLTESAHALGPNECANAAEKAQKLRDESKLRAARAELITCSAESCPLVIRRDCVKWIGEVDAALPTIVVRVRDDGGHDIVDGRLTVDGVVISDPPGRPIPLDPGVHDVTVELREKTATERIVVARGERDRLVSIALPSPHRPPPPPTPEQPPPRPPPKDPGTPATRIVAYALGGVGVAALGVFGFFDIKGVNGYESLKDGCGASRSCSDAEVDKVERDFTVAKVSLGISIGALVAAGALFVLSLDSSEPKSARIFAPRF